MSIIKKEISLLVSSDSQDGAINKSSDGSSFEVALEKPLDIPKDAQNVTIGVTSSTIWWNIHNIKAGVNDAFYITYNDGEGIDDYSGSIPPGLYDLNNYGSAVNKMIENNGGPSGLLIFSGDGATSKVIITFTETNIIVDFTQTDTARLILGFNSQLLSNIAVSPLNFLADNEAGFNVIDYFLLHSDLTDQGIRINNKYNNVIARVLINVSPGSQIVTNPFNVIKTSAVKLRGGLTTDMRFWLTDQNSNAVNTNEQNWSMELNISYF